MSALLFKPDAGEPEFVAYPRTLEEHQAYVGGFLQLMPTTRTTYPFIVFVDEMGRLKDRVVPNHNAMYTLRNVLYEMPVGNVLVVKEDNKGETVGATQEELRAFMQSMQSKK